MNGRVYDPKVGRFLSVDPVFQFPENTQSLNPYTYVLNSALSFSDPTGFTCDGEDDNGCKEKTKARENSEARDKRAEQKAKDRGASITHYGRGDTTNAERQSGTQSNGARLAEADRGTYANTPRGADPDKIEAPGTQVAMATPGAAAPGGVTPPNVATSDSDYTTENLSDEEKAARIARVNGLVTVKAASGSTVTDEQVALYRRYVEEVALTKVGWAILGAAAVEPVTVVLSSMGDSYADDDLNAIRINVGGDGYSPGAGGTFVKLGGFRTLAHELAGHYLSRNIGRGFVGDQAAMGNPDGGSIGIENRITAQRYAMLYGGDAARANVGIRISHDSVAVPAGTPSSLIRR
jgi:hypothetical protein